MVSRHFRDSATASKPGIASGFVVGDAINEFLRVHNTDHRIALQQIHRVESRLAPDIDEMPEIPAHEEIDAMHRAYCHMHRVVGISFGNHAGFQVFVRKVVGLTGAKSSTRNG